MLYFENIGSSIRVSENIEKMDRPAAPDVVMPKAAPQKAVQPKAPGQSPAAGGIKPPKAVSTAVYPQYQLSPRIREQFCLSHQLRRDAGRESGDGNAHSCRASDACSRYDFPARKYGDVQ